MYVVLGASGHIGSSVVKALQERELGVTAVVHSRENADALDGPHTTIRVVDIRDARALAGVLGTGQRAFLLNPPANPGTDTDAAEMATASSIAEAVRHPRLEKVVVASTYGAQPGIRIGDLSVLYAFERMVEATGVPTAINRGAYYFTNLDQFLDAARAGRIETPFPGGLVMPMVSPDDLGVAAVARLMSAIDDVGVQYVEGPERLTFRQVAEVFAEELGRSVELATTPRAEIETYFRSLGFSNEAAASYTRMMKATIDGVELPDSPTRGSTNARDYIGRLVKRER